MRSLLENLKSLNRKERFYLIDYALSDKNDYEFKLSERFKKSVEEVLSDQKIKINDNYYLTMDYHFDWIYASLYITKVGTIPNIVSNNGIIKGNQEDVDLLLAVQEDKKCHLILIEAKADTEWKNKQFKSKIKRIKKIFGENGNKFQEVTPHLILISPKKPNNLDISYVPNWLLLNGKLRYIELKLPNLKKVNRCDKSGKSNSQGLYWTLVDV